MPSPLSGTQTEEQDGGSDDEDRNELFAILQEASSDEEPEGDEDAADTQEDDADDLNVDVDIEEDTTELSSELINWCSVIRFALNSLGNVLLNISHLFIIISCTSKTAKKASNLNQPSDCFTHLVQYF